MLHAGIVDTERERVRAHSAADPHALLKVLLTAHCELTEVAAEQAQLLRALLLRGNGGDRALGRSGLSHSALSTLLCRKPPRDASDGQMARHAEVQRIAHVILAYRDELAANREQMATVVNELSPGITARPGTGPFKAAKAILESAS